MFAFIQLFIDKDHPLASVRNVFNAIFIHGNAVGDTMFYGKGAGERPTASAVLADIIDVARDMGKDRFGKIRCTCYEEKKLCHQIKFYQDIIFAY